MLTRSDIGLVRGATSGSGDNAQCKVPAGWSMCAMHHEAPSFLPVLPMFSAPRSAQCCSRGRGTNHQVDWCPDGREGHRDDQMIPCSCVQESARHALRLWDGLDVGSIPPTSIPGRLRAEEEGSLLAACWDVFPSFPPPTGCRPRCGELSH